MRDDACAVFEAALSCFQRANQTHAARSLPRYYEIADSTLELRFAGPALVPHILPALDPPTIEPISQSSLTICLWDGASSMGNVPRLSWEGELVTRRGDIQGFGNERIHAAFDRAADLLSLYDARRDLGLFCTRDAKRFPFNESTAPLRTLLFWMLRERGKVLLHAGAIGNDVSAVLLAGKGGSGKSTTALACLNSPLDYIADDYCVVAPDAAPRVWRLYNTAKITAESLNSLPFLKSLAVRESRHVRNKVVLFLNQHFPSKLARTRPLKAILLPRVTGRTTPRLCPAPADAALSALAVSTLVQFPGAGGETLAALDSLTARLPSYFLDLGNVAKIPSMIQEFLG